MGRLVFSLPVKVPIDRVFAYVDDYRNTTRYMQDLSRWEPAGAKTHGKGAQFSVAMKAGPISIDGVVDITEWAENRTIAWKSIKGLKQTGRWSFSSDGPSLTTVTLEAEFELPGGIAGRVMARAAEPILKGNLERSVKALKEQAERLVATGPTAKPAARPGGKPAGGVTAKAPLTKASTPRAAGPGRRAAKP